MTLVSFGQSYISKQDAKEGKISTVQNTVINNGNKSITDAGDFFSDNFEGGLSAWTLYDEDGDANNWILTSSNVGHNEGECASSASWQSAALTPDNWMVSPAIDLSTAGAGITMLEFWRKAQDQNWPSEKYSVYISTSGNTVADFTGASGTLLLDAEIVIADQWQKRTFNIDSYSGTVYIAFRHHDCSDMYILDIDDVRVYENNAIDGGITNIVVPNNTACAKTATEDVTVSIFNYGGVDLNNFNVSYTINGGTPVIETVATAIPPASSYDYTFTQKADLSILGFYDIEVSLDITSDDDATNNSLLVENIASADALLSVDVSTDANSAQSWYVINTQSGDTVAQHGAYQWNLTNDITNVCIVDADCYKFSWEGSGSNTVILSKDANVVDNRTATSDYIVYGLGSGCPGDFVTFDSIILPKSVGLNNGDVYVSGLVVNTGTSTLTSFEVTYAVDGAAAVAMYTVSCNVATGDSCEFTHDVPWTPSLGEHNIVITVGNANGNGSATMSENTDILVMNEAFPTIVFYEEGGGTWNVWEPRGIVGLNTMAHNHEVDNTWIGIAVHNGDPMEDPTYNTAISAYITGYPSGIINRKSTPVDPKLSTLEEQYNLQILDAPVAKIEESSQTYNIATKAWTLGVATTFGLDLASADYNTALIIIEDSVTGTSTDWDQANNYNEGTYGAMEDWNGFDYVGAGNPIPAVDMVYNHVGRLLVDGFSGSTGSIPAAVTYNVANPFSYSGTLDPSWNPQNISFVAIIIDNATGEVVNAVKIKLNIPSALAEFTASSTSICPSESVTFTDASISATSWNWDFGDGSTSVLQNPSHVYNSTGNYTVTLTVSNATESDIETKTNYITVLASTLINSQPGNVNTCLGNSASFSVNATGSNLGYQWKKNGNNISGATSSTYNITSVTTSNLGAYSCVVSGDCGNIVSASADLTVSPVTITTHPVSASVCEGASVTFNITATGSNLTYQWKKDGNNISGATSSSYNIASVTAGNYGTYSCLVSGDCGNTTSEEANLSMPIPVINTHPLSTSVCEGTAVTFNITATGSNLTYQWKKNGNNISGAISNSYSVSNTNSTHVGNYICVVTNECGNTANSNIAMLEVYNSTIITSQPNSISVTETSDASFTVEATGDNLSYQWKKNGFDIPGATSNLYSITNVNSNNAGDYACMVSGTCGNILSDVVTLSVNSMFSIDVTTNDASCGNSDGTATVNVTGGSGNYAYLWSNGSTLSSAQDLSAGTHSVQVTDNDNNYTENTFFNIDNSEAPNISFVETHNLCYGDALGSSQVNISGGIAPYQIEWSTGSTSETIINLNSGIYSVTVVDANDCLISSQTTITSPAQIELSFTTTNSTCGNSDGAIFANPTGGTGAYSYLWSNGANSAYNSGLPSGTYTLTVQDANSCEAEFVTGFSDSGAPTVIVDNIISASCNQQGSVYVSVSGGSGAYSYNWSDGQTSQNLINVDPGYYWLTVSDGNCVTNLQTEVSLIYPQEQPICVVTVDPETNKNLVVWEKVETSGIDYYNVYRETFADNEYELVASVPFADMSEFSDPVANPFSRSWKYKLSAVDACGNESSLSIAHKTIHLNINLGLGGSINLIWDDYEGIDYSSFSINRHTTAEGWEEITQLPTSLHSFTDAPEDLYGLWYSVTVNTPSACVPTSLSRAAGGPYYQASSNIEDEGAIDTKTISLEENIKIYPNPTSGDVQILGVWMDEIEILNTSGQIVLKKEVNAKYLRLDLSTQAAGIYYIKIIGKTNTSVQKLILE